jgi:mono/diheme cytochrome c family protein
VARIDDLSRFDREETESGRMSRSSTGLIIGTVLAFGSLVSISGQTTGSNTEAKKLKNPVRSSPQSIATGKQLYTKQCTACHGADAKGDGPMAPKDSHPSNLTDKEWTHGSSDGEIFVVLRDGLGPKSVMRGYKARMTEEELWSVVNYLRSVAATGTH